LFEIAEELDAFLHFEKDVAIVERWTQTDPGQSVNGYEAKSL
jgi:hypothetical protein